MRGLPPDLRHTYTSERLQFLDGLVDLASVAVQADWVINHANHNTAAVFMQAGLPQLLIPQQQEQLLLALRLVAHGGALLAYQDQAGFGQDIRQMLSDPALRAQARTLAQSVQGADADGTVASLRAMLQTWLG